MEAWLLISLAEIGEAARHLMYIPSPAATNHVSQTATTQVSLPSPNRERVLRLES